MKTVFAKIWRFISLPKNIQLFIMRLFQDQFLIGVTGIIFNKKREILLFKHTYRQTEWSLPGGYIKSKEHPAEGLEREIKEESDFTVNIDYQLKVRTDRESARLDIALIGEYIGGEFIQSSEVKEAKFFSFENLPLIAKNQLFLIELALQEHPYVLQAPPVRIKRCYN
jgi:8-oxo-dGTP diphosphatase